jgi:1-acyl-sn-glycerol-3-phosphate acyltransferase
MNGVKAAIRSIAASILGKAIILFARFVTAPRALWLGIEPSFGQRVYFANHTSNGDFVLIWTVLPLALRNRTRPVAALDYWLKSPLRAFVGRDVFNAVLIDRRPENRTEDPVTQMAQALDEGSSLILFPEGQRNGSEAGLLPFKSGLYHLARQRPHVDLVPVWISNLNYVMPKGQVIPVPLICTLAFGAPIRLDANESKEEFLARASAALLAMRENGGGQ